MSVIEHHIPSIPKNRHLFPRIPSVCPVMNKSAFPDPCNYYSTIFMFWQYSKYSFLKFFAIAGVFIMKNFIVMFSAFCYIIRKNVNFAGGFRI